MSVKEVKDNVLPIPGAPPLTRILKSVFCFLPKMLFSKFFSNTLIALVKSRCNNGISKSYSKVEVRPTFSKTTLSITSLTGIKGNKH